MSKKQSEIRRFTTYLRRLSAEAQGVAFEAVADQFDFQLSKPKKPSAGVARPRKAKADTNQAIGGLRPPASQINARD